MTEEKKVSLFEMPEEALREQITFGFAATRQAFGSMRWRADHAALVAMFQNELNRRLLEQLLSRSKNE